MVCERDGENGGTEEDRTGGGSVESADGLLPEVDGWGWMLDAAWERVVPGVDYVSPYREAAAAIKAVREAHQAFVKHRGPWDRLMMMQRDDGAVLVGWFLEPAALREIAELMQRGGESAR